MRWSSSVLLITCLLTYRCFADKPDIGFIDKKVKAINIGLKRYKKIRRDIMESTEGGIITGYFAKDSLKKMVAVYYCETHKSIVQYYFSGKDVCFISWKDFIYTKPVYEKGGGKVSKVQLYKYYFDKTLIKAIPASGDSREASNDLIDDAVRYEKILNE